jgi:hypothetical protein
LLRWCWSFLLGDLQGWWVNQRGLFFEAWGWMFVVSSEAKKVQGKKCPGEVLLGASNGATDTIHVLYRHIHCIVFIFKYKMSWRICIVLGTQYNTIHSKNMYSPYQSTPQLAPFGLLYRRENTCYKGYVVANLTSCFILLHLACKL